MEINKTATCGTIFVGSPVSAEEQMQLQDSYDKQFQGRRPDLPVVKDVWVHVTLEELRSSGFNQTEMNKVMREPELRAVNMICLIPDMDKQTEETIRKQMSSFKLQSHSSGRAMGLVLQSFVATLNEDQTLKLTRLH